MLVIFLYKNKTFSGISNDFACLLGKRIFKNISFVDFQFYNLIESVPGFDLDCIISII